MLLITRYKLMQILNANGFVLEAKYCREQQKEGSMNQWSILKFYPKKKFNSKRAGLHANAWCMIISHVKVP